MSRQFDPNTYMVNSCIPLQDAAKMKTHVTAKKTSMSSFMATLVHTAVKDVKVSPEAKKWSDKMLKSNKKRRQHADELTRSGVYRKGNSKGR